VNKHQAAAFLRLTLMAERGMRERVFRNDEKKRKAKVSEIDTALEALAVLKVEAGVTDESHKPPPTLFDQ